MKKKNIILLITILILSLFIIGCGQSEKDKIASQYIGTWEKRDTSDDTMKFAHITVITPNKANNNTLIAQTYFYTKSDNKPINMKKAEPMVLLYSEKDKAFRLNSPFAGEAFLISETNGKKLMHVGVGQGLSTKISNETKEYTVNDVKF